MAGARDSVPLDFHLKGFENHGRYQHQPWTWDEQTWRSKVEHVRAGRSMKPAEWKNGARCAVALSFDSDHETNELRDGGKSIGRMSQGQYGNRRAAAHPQRARQTRCQGHVLRAGRRGPAL